MIALFCFFLTLLVSPFKSKSRLEAENVALRRSADHIAAEGVWSCSPHQQRSFLLRPAVSMVSIGSEYHQDHPAGDPYALASGGFPVVLAVEVPVPWRPAADLRALIWRMSVDNPLWGAPRIHGELLKLGFEVAQSSVAKYMVKRCGPPSQGWRTFLRNHAPDIAAMDLFVVPTIGFDLLYASSLSGWRAETSSGSTSHLIRPRTGSHARLRRHSLGMRPRAT
jgi:hypothetical protein